MTCEFAVMPDRSETDVNRKTKRILTAIAFFLAVPEYAVYNTTLMGFDTERAVCCFNNCYKRSINGCQTLFFFNFRN